MNFHAENGEDFWIATNLELPQRGTWVDVGCAHPHRFSQTAFLRDWGWDGLAIDANPAYAAEWQGVLHAHFINAVVSDEPEVHFLVEPTNSLVSRRHETGALVQCTTLDELTKFVDRIDFLALDIEGMEFSALQSLNLGLKPPTIIVSEYDSEHAGQDFRVLHYLLRRGYELVHLTSNNAVYLYTK